MYALDIMSCALIRVTRLGNFLPIGRFLKVRGEFLSRLRSPKIGRFFGRFLIIITRVIRLGEISPFGQFFMALGKFFSRKNSPMIWAKF